MSTGNGKISDPKVEKAIKDAMPSPAAMLQAMRYDHIRRLGDVLTGLFNALPFMPDPKIDDAFEVMFNVMAGSAVRSKIPYAYLKDRLKVRYDEVERQTRGEKPALSLVGVDGAQLERSSTDDEKTDPGSEAGTESPSTPAAPAPAAPSPEGSPAPEPASALASTPTGAPDPQPGPPATEDSAPPAAPPEPPPAS